MREVVLRYLILPDIEDGVSGFYEHYDDKRCVEPSKPYINGRCHTIGPEMDDLAEKVGFMKREDYAQIRKMQKYTSWKNAYGSELSLVVGKILKADRIVLNVKGENVLFCCPRGEFVGWPWRKYLK